MTKFRWVLFGLLAGVLIAALTPAKAEVRAYCFSPQVPPRVHNIIEPHKKFEWDNRSET